MWKFAANLTTKEEMLGNTELKSHGNKVFEALTGAIVALEKTEILSSVLADLGGRHTDYGAKIQHFPVILKITFVFNPSFF